MFAAVVPWGHYGSSRSRSGRRPDQTTDPQAEVLYPSDLLLDHLHTIATPDEAVYESVFGILANFPAHEPEVAITPEAFL